MTLVMVLFVALMFLSIAAILIGKKVKASGMDFAIIRVAGRYYGGGGLYTDEKGIANIEGAINAGIDATIASSSAVQISWSKGDGGTYYLVYRTTDPNGKWSLIGEFNENTTSAKCFEKYCRCDRIGL